MRPETAAEKCSRKVAGKPNNSLESNKTAVPRKEKVCADPADLRGDSPEESSGREWTDENLSLKKIRNDLQK